MRKKFNEAEFNRNLKKLGKLYEGGKDLIVKISPAIPMPTSIKAQIKMYKTLKEMRDMCAEYMQRVHFVENEN